MNKLSSSTFLIATYVFILIILTVASTLLISNQLYAFLIITLSLTVLCIAKIIVGYSDPIKKTSFMFNAIECDDYSFKFRENTSNVNNNMLNTSLNRIKEILDNAKIRAMEREKYYELIMNSVKTGIITINNNGNVYQVNERIMKLFNLQTFTHINQLRVIDRSLVYALQDIKSGERSQVSYRNERGEIKLSLTASTMEYDGKLLKIISVNDINNELDEKEVESWVKLTRILTHEIMNSLAPITSLSNTLLSINEDKNSDIAKGLETINLTGKSLTTFIESYRKFTCIQAPVKTPFLIKPLIKHVSELLVPKEVALKIIIEPDDIMVYADADLISQVIVNLIKNAVQANINATNRTLEIQCYIYDNEDIILNISNNGGAIPEEIVQDIFMPFFTTKKDGSGVGLSMAKQIMRLHNGSISLTSNTEERVTFTLIF